jgi:hypothetical protein
MRPTLLVAGYSDNDWDIFPVLIKESRQLRKVIWVEYADTDKADWDQIEAGKPCGRVKSWLKTLGCSPVLLYGDCKQFCCDILHRLGLTALDIPEDDGKERRPDICTG